MPKEKGFFRPDEAAVSYERDLNDPGQYPFTRGLYTEMYRKKPPTIREFAGHGLAPDTNERFKALLREGATGLSTAFDLPTLMGRDSNDPLSEGQVGWDGVAVDTLADMEELFSGIAIDEVSVSMTVSGPAAVIWAMYLVMAGKRGIPFERLHGTLQNDILKEYVAQKEWLFPEDAGVRLVVDTIEFAARFLPKWHPVSVSGYHIREAGATAVQEVAFTLADGIEYLRRSAERGLSLAEVASQLSFFFDAHNNFAEEIAKLRAARKLWARIVKERFGIDEPRAQWLRMHVQTAGCTLTRQEPENNVVRVAFQALAAMLGGAQSVHTNSYDEVLCTPTMEAVKRAVRTQQILQKEIGIADFPDLFGGAYAIEHLTREIERAAEEEIVRIDALGGMREAAKKGYPQRAIRSSALAYERAVEEGRIMTVGVNVCVGEDGEKGDPAHVSEELATRRGFEERQIARLARVVKERNIATVNGALYALQRAAEERKNVMSALMDAAAAYATLGEMCAVLKHAWGEYKEREIFSAVSPAADMKAAAARHRLKRPVRILVAKGGLDGHDRVIYTLVEFLKELGAEVIYPGLHCSMKEIAKRAMEEDVEVVGLSTHIGSPAVLFLRLRDELRSLGRKDAVIIGGGIIRESEIASLHALGVSHFSPVGSSFEETAQFLHEIATRPRRRREDVSPVGFGECARLLSAVENNEDISSSAASFPPRRAHIIGITGSTAAGKSTLIDKVLLAIRGVGFTVVVLAVDPSEDSSGGAVLGDVIRMRDHYADPGVFLRSMSSRGSQSALPVSCGPAIDIAARHADFVIVETMGARQTDRELAEYVDTFMALPDTRGDAINLLKAGHHRHAHILVVNTRNMSLEDARFVDELRGMLPLIFAGGAPPLVFPVDARTGRGVSQLVRDGIFPRMKSAGKVPPAG